MPLKIHVRRLNVLTNTTCSPAMFGLEEYSIENKSNSYAQRIALTCGLCMDNFAVGARFVTTDGYVVPLMHDEARAKAQFMTQKGLVRAASVYYSLDQCRLFARLSITIPDKRVPNRYKTHLVVYAVPDDIPRTNEIVCKDINLPPQTLNCITQQMLTCIRARNIIPLAG